MLNQARGQPGYGLTLGVRDILQSREILLLVSGAQKAPQLRRLLRPEISPQFPASFLWLHAAVTVCCDVAAFPASPADSFQACCGFARIVYMSGKCFAAASR